MTLIVRFFGPPSIVEIINTVEFEISESETRSSTTKLKLPKAKHMDLLDLDEAKKSGSKTAIRHF
jgi:hypothetical protein